MGIDMTKYKMIYKNKVYNCLYIMPLESLIRDGEVIDFKLSVTYIDENNRIAMMEDSNSEFQFVLK